MRYLYSILILTFLFSCKEKLDSPIDARNENLLVVDALITNEYIQHEVQLSKTVNELNGVPEKVSGATITITDGDSIYVFVEDSSELGTYISSPFSAVIGKYYFLSIDHEGNNYAAEAYMIPVTHFSYISYSQNDNDLYYINDNFSSMEDAMWEISLDWSHIIDDSLNTMNKALLYYYTLHTVDIAQIFASKTETVYFPSGTIITQKKYSLSHEYAAFIRTLLSETEWSGGYFDVMPANLSTNLSNGAIGFFAVCTVMENTVIVK